MFSPTAHYGLELRMGAGWTLAVPNPAIDAEGSRREPLIVAAELLRWSYGRFDMRRTMLFRSQDVGYIPRTVKHPKDLQRIGVGKIDNQAGVQTPKPDWKLGQILALMAQQWEVRQALQSALELLAHAPGHLRASVAYVTYNSAYIILGIVREKVLCHGGQADA